ncbi:hypothetical protein ACWGI8_16955 [Streptomyces sp. NPDC054841]
MGDVLLALCIPLTVCASGIYAVCESWWRRRRPAPPSPLPLPFPSRFPPTSLSPSPSPSPYAHAGARLAEREMLVAAEEIVAEAYARLANLYDDRCAGAYDHECTAAYGGISAGSTPDHDPSSPAPARTGTHPPAH